MTGKRTGLSEICLEAPFPGTLLEALRERGICPEDGCMGAGYCGRCRVRYLEGAPLPEAAERRIFSPEELRSGVRLACLHRVNAPCRVEIEFVQAPRTRIVTESGFQAAGGQVSGADAAYRIAVDLGTTTIAMQARAVSNGRVLAEWKRMNPQRRYGSDVISRIRAAGEGKAEELKACADEALAEGLRSLTGICKARMRPEILLAGNTVMEHLLAGLPTDGLGRYPFSPVTLQEQRVRIGGQGTAQYDLTLLPGISAFVGADVLAGILAAGMHRKKEICLLIDLGTNGEMVLGNCDRLLCTATAAGPAFEGRAGTEGTDMIAVTGELLEAGLVDGTGLLAEPWFSEGADWEPKGQPGRRVHITQEDIRAVQMAKAAVFAGIQMLVRRYGIDMEDIARVWLAGGFGYFLDVARAAQIGLLPPSLAGRTEAVGNTALAGAFLYGESGGREEAARIREICEPIDLAAQEGFSEMYLSHLNFAEQAEENAEGPAVSGPDAE